MFVVIRLTKKKKNTEKQVNRAKPLSKSAVCKVFSEQR